MASKNLQKVSLPTSEVSKFYEGKSLFITGASGFLGQVLLEILLRCCPGIIKIYILLRPKNGLKPEERRAVLFKKLLFNKLTRECPDALNKVIVLSGDVSQDELGMSEQDRLKIIKEVSVVFHCAATLSFFRPISFLMTQNVIGIDNIINLCKQMPKLEALVYTSSLYSNCNREKDISEIVYKLPFKAEEVVQLTRNGNADGLTKLYLRCKPNFQLFYVFSKCVSENLLAEKAHDLPVCIVRPSMIISCMRGAMPGYVEDGTAFVSLGLGCGKGFIRVLKDYSKNRTEYVPVDIAANTHVVAAFFQATESLPSPSVYNCTSGSDNPLTWREFLVVMTDSIIKYPLPNTYIIPSLTLCSNFYLYKFYTYIYHFIPAMIIDIFLWMSGIELRLTKLYNFVERITNVTEELVKKQFQISTDNFVSLSKKLNETDVKKFYIDIREFKLEEFLFNFHTGCPFYYVNNKPYKDTFQARILRYFLTCLLKFVQLGIVAALCYFVFWIFMLLL